MCPEPERRLLEKSKITRGKKGGKREGDFGGLQQPSPPVYYELCPHLQKNKTKKIPGCFYGPKQGVFI
jgi:hypothetical protein